MKTLHDMLKQEEKAKSPSSGQQDELRGRYSKIGISAVAAATQFNRNDDRPAPQRKADHSSARGWSRHG